LTAVLVGKSLLSPRQNDLCPSIVQNNFLTYLAQGTEAKQIVKKTRNFAPSCNSPFEIEQNTDLRVPRCPIPSSPVLLSCASIVVDREPPPIDPMQKRPGKVCGVEEEKVQFEVVKSEGNVNLSKCSSNKKNTSTMRQGEWNQKQQSAIIHKTDVYKQTRNNFWATQQKDNEAATQGEVLKYQSIKVPKY
jgi:hypothetical protein